MNRLSGACVLMIIMIIAPVPGSSRSSTNQAQNVSMPQSKMFLLNVTSVYPLVSAASEGWAANLSRGISQQATSNGYGLTVVSTFSDWDSLLRNPPTAITVFSAHWNWMLIPASWSNSSWQQFYTYVANLIVTKGWIMHSNDWPFYGYYREGDGAPTMVGPAGTNMFLSVVGASMDAWSDSISPDTSTLTLDGSRAASSFGLTLPNVMNGNGLLVFNHRAVRWNGITPALTFYRTQPWNGAIRYPASAIQMGAGFFADVQWTENLTLHAQMIFAFTTILASTFFDDFSGNQLGPGWMVENYGGNYSIGNSTLTLSTNGPSVTAYRSFTPLSDSFVLTTRVESSALAGFAMMIHAGSLPIFGSPSGANLEFDSSVENKHFLAAWEPAGGGWIWSSFYGPSVTNTWFILDMKVDKNPLTITFTVLNDNGTVLGNFIQGSFGFTYGNIRYVALEAWASPLSYSVDWTRIVSSPPPTLRGDFNETPSIAVAGRPVTFSAQASGGLPSYQFEWDFGDGSSGSGQSTVHSYYSRGTFTVSLTIIDSSSATFMVTHSMLVKPGPIINQVVTFEQVTARATGYFDTSANPLKGIINLSVVNTTTSQTLLSKTFNISTVYPYSGPLRFILLIPDSPVGLALGCGADLNTNQTSCVLSRNPDVAHRGVVDIVDYSILLLNFGAGQGSPSYSPALDLADNGRVDIVSVGIVAEDYGAQVFA